MPSKLKPSKVLLVTPFGSVLYFVISEQPYFFVEWFPLDLPENKCTNRKKIGGNITQKKDCLSRMSHVTIYSPHTLYLLNLHRTFSGIIEPMNTISFLPVVNTQRIFEMVKKVTETVDLMCLRRNRRSVSS